MRAKRGWHYKAVVSGAAVFLGLAGAVHSQIPAPKGQPANCLLPSAGTKSQVAEADVLRVLDALGPVMLEEIRQGNQEKLQKVGIFKIVRIAEHKDIERGTGRPMTCLPRTTWFLIGRRNGNRRRCGGRAPGGIRAQFEYNTLPGQTPAQKTGRTKVPPVRSK